MEICRKCSIYFVFLKLEKKKIANICWIIEKAREFQTNIDFCFIEYTKAFDCVGHKKLWKILQEMGIPDHLTCLLRNLYAGHEAIVRTGHETTDWFQVGKGVHQGCMLSPCLFNLYAEDIMINAGLDEAQAGIKIAERNINNLRYADAKDSSTRTPTMPQGIVERKPPQVFKGLKVTAGGEVDTNSLLRIAPEQE